MNEIKLTALNAAIDANLENAYTEDGKLITDVNKLLEAAEKIEAYLNEKETTNEQ